MHNCATESYAGIIIRKHIAELYDGDLVWPIDFGRCIMADILRQVYCGICITADIAWQVHYGRYIMADILRHIYYSRPSMTNILRQWYYGRYIMADMSRQIYYGCYITADTLRQIYCVPRERPYLNKCTAPEAIDCCIRICFLQPITPANPRTCQTAMRPPQGAPREPTRPRCIFGNNS